LWRHRGGVVEPPLRLTDLKYDGRRGVALAGPRRGA
jgi:hypothetical protein